MLTLSFVLPCNSSCLQCLLYCQSMGIEAVLVAAVDLPIPRRTVAHLDPFRTCTFLVVGFVAGHAGCETKGMRLCQCFRQCLLPESQSSDCDRRQGSEAGQTVLPALPLSGCILGRVNHLLVLHETHSALLMSACNVDLATSQTLADLLLRHACLVRIEQPHLPVYGSIDSTQIRPMACSICVAAPRRRTR